MGSTPNPASRERRAGPGGRREPVAGAPERLGQRDEPPLVAIRDRQQRERRLAVARAAAGTSDAPVSALAMATRGSSAIPMTSPVDCMNGPTDGSTPLSFAVENAGALTATNGGGGRSPGSQPRSASVAPSPIRTASSTIGTPVTLDRNGTVRLARGLTSIRYTPSSRTMNCALTRPLAPSARQIRSIVCTIRSTSPSDTCCGGNTAIESPEWTPARSTCSSRPGMRTPMPSHTASMSTSMPSRKRSMRTGRSGSTIGGRGEVADEVLGRVREVDREPADDERRPDDDRVADALRERQRLLDRLGHAALRLRDAEPVQERGEPDPLLRLVDRLEVRAEQRHAGRDERPREVERRLAAERDDRRQRVGPGQRPAALELDDAPDALGVERLEVQPRARVEVGGHGLRVGVDHHRAPARAAQDVARPGPRSSRTRSPARSGPGRCR